ncbi:MAG: gliding motility-associated ABC transporter substrate-binding protein GldG [Bacteroidetes bacterium]|nr:MAG: gliding motility-associated ABC transporter substrate-binding protein GldG [Bacteroidota bacterium]
MNSIGSKILNSKFWWLWLLVFLFGVNFLASQFHSRYDLTKEKRYTLSKATKKILSSLDDDISIEIFLKGDFPTGFRKLAGSVREFAGLMKDINGSKVHYRFISPQDDFPGVGGMRYEDTLVGMGAIPINLTVQVKAGQENKRIYPVALIKYKGKQALVNLYSGGKRMITPVEINSAEALMEYQFAKTLNSLLNEEKPLVAYSVGNGEPANARSYALQQALRTDYQLFTFNINQQKTIPDTFETLIIVKPSIAFSDEEKFKIDQYVMRGGKLLLFIDGLNAEQDSLGFKPELVAYDRNLNLTDILFRYGVRINPDLVMDLQCDFMPFAVGGNAENPQYEYLHWNYYPLFESMGNHATNKNIGLVAGRFVNSIDTIKVEGVKKTPLLYSSANSRKITTPALISLNENRNAPQDNNFRENAIPVAILLEGKFTSLYKGRTSKSVIDTMAAMGLTYRESSDENKIIVVSDGDIVLNDFSPKDGPLEMGVNLFTVGSQYEYQFANREFLLNSLEYLTGNPDIIETRNKEIVLRQLDPVKVKVQKTTWQFINIALPILLVILCGWVYQQIRKRKYAA